MALTSKEVADWTSKISQAESFQKRHHKRWRDSLNWLNLRYLQSVFKGSETEWTEVHWVWNYFNTLVPTLYAKNPNVIVKSRRKNSVPFAETQQKNLNYHNEELGLKGYVQSAVKDTVPYGLGYIEVGYEPTDLEIKALDAVHKDSISMKTLQAKVQKLVTTALGGEDRKDSGPQLLPTIRQGSPYLRWIEAWRVLLAPGYHNIEEMPQLIIIEDVEPEDLIRNPRYKRSKVENLKPTRRISTSAQISIKSGNPIFSSGGSGDLKLIRLFHIWDRRNLEYIVLPAGSQEEILHWPWIISTNEFLISQLAFNKLPPSEQDAATYPMDDITPIKPQLVEKSLLRTDMIKARRRSAPLIYMNKNANSEREAQKLSDAGIANIVLLDNITPEAIRGDNPIRIPSDIFKVDETINNDLTTVSGFSSLVLSGASPTSNETATEANIAQSGLTLRSIRKGDIIEDFIKQIDRKLAMVCWEKCDRFEIGRILGLTEVTEEMWPDITDMSRTEKMDKMARELDFRIEAHSSQPDQVRLVEINVWMKSINMLLAVAGDVINKDQLTQRFLKKLQVPEIEAVMKPDGETSRQEAEQENQLLLQGILQLAHKGDRHDIHIPTHGQAGILAQNQQQDTSTLDQHIQMHAQLMQADRPQGQGRPQAGDTGSPQQAGQGTAELQRKGVEKFPDMQGEVSSPFSGTGSEAPSGL